MGGNVYVYDICVYTRTHTCTPPVKRGTQSLLPGLRECSREVGGTNRDTTTDSVDPFRESVEEPW